jgi:acetyl esterase/lipase
MPTIRLHLFLVLLLSCFILSSPAAGQTATIPLWPKGVPDPQPVPGPERDMSPRTEPGHNPQITNVSIPEMSVYPPVPPAKNTGAALLVFPGGGYRFLNMKNAGTDPCDWATSIGMTCFLVKYRVPVAKYYPEQKAPLEDAQQAIRIVRSRAKEWGVDPTRIGLMGFSAGGNLVLLINSHPDDAAVMSTPAVEEVPMDHGQAVDARSNFTIACWPAFVAVKPDETTLNPVYKPNAFTPPTFLIQAEDDVTAGNNALVYYRALMDAKVPSELHYYQSGGHAFGMHPERFAQARWAEIAANWLRFNKVISGWTGPSGTAERKPEAVPVAP